MSTYKAQVNRLKSIKSVLKRGEQKQLSVISKVNEGQLSVYLNRPEHFDLNLSIVNKILIGYDKLTILNQSSV
jgi:hypothetical protein